MTTRGDWDYALHIKGVSKKTLDMARLAEYLYEFALMLGKDAQPRFAGVVNGSAILRAKEYGNEPSATHLRLISIASNDDSAGHAPYKKILSMMRENGARGEIVDRNKAVLVRFETAKVANDQGYEIVMHDEAEIDGVVVGVIGIDDTAHVRLQISPSTVYKLLVRDMSIARRLAAQFRGETVRVHVHGRWKCTPTGAWEPHTLYIDRIEDLDQRAADEIMHELLLIKGNGWSEMLDPDDYWKKIRGIDDSSN